MKISVLSLFLIGIAAAGGLYSEEWTNSVLSGKLTVNSYRVVRYTMTSENGKRERLITREIGTDKGERYYFIDTATLRYGLTDKPEGIKKEGGPSPESFLGKVLGKQSEDGRPYGTSDEFHSGPSNKNLILTSDLCPTGRDYDNQFYSNLVSMKRDHRINVPLVIFFSGSWLMNHQSQLSRIKNTGLEFIAGNHTYKHLILNAKNSNPASFTGELTNTEAVMLENGILPSWFFRYPGLLYNKSYMKVLGELSMAAVNANVWMGTKARNWGILLVHSNGCASSEVRVFAAYTGRNLKRLQDGDLQFHSIYSYLRETLQFPKAEN